MLYSGKGGGRGPLKTQDFRKTEIYSVLKGEYFNKFKIFQIILKTLHYFIEAATGENALCNEKALNATLSKWLKYAADREGGRLARMRPQEDNHH